MSVNRSRGFEQLAETISRATAEGWVLSPERMLMVIVLSVEALSLHYLARFPMQRDAVLARLQQVRDRVEAETDDGRHEVTH